MKKYAIDDELMPRKKKQDIMHRACNRYGTQNQLLKTIEECNELGSAIAKYLISPKSKENENHVLEEIADVSIMIQQLRTFIFDDAEIEYIERKKLERLEGWLKNGR